MIDSIQKMTLLITTPTLEKFELEIVPKKEKEKLLSSGYLFHSSYFQILWDVEIYSLGESFMILYTADSYAVLVNGARDLQLFRGYFYSGTLNIIRNKERFFYMYPLETNFIINDNRPLVKDCISDMLANQTEKITFEDGSVMHIYRQSEKVFSGAWFESEEMYRFFSGNDYL